MTGETIQTLRESEKKIWSYESVPIVPGALRLIKVNELLTKDATIAVSEWTDLDLTQGKPGVENSNIPKYATISHSWAASEEVQRISAAANRPLSIDLGEKEKPKKNANNDDQDTDNDNDKQNHDHATEKKLHEISWLGLTQAAKAAQFLGCEYLWLDLACIHQDRHDDKVLQIAIMGHVYERAIAVIVMPGGVAAAQDIDHYTPWMTRAWTLQEATLSPDNVHVLILHEKWDRDNYDYTVMTTGPWYNVKNIDDHLAVSGLRDLLSCRKGGLKIERTSKSTGYTEKVPFTVRCFGEDEALITALEGLITGQTDAMRKSAAWRSMWLRTSTKPQDMVFSVMHLLGVHIDVDYKRDREGLVLELARKTSSFPSWLDIGFNIPFDPRFGLVPALPLFLSNSAPCYDLDGEVPVHKFIEQGTYITEYDLKILTPSDASMDGDIICSEIFAISYERQSEPTISNAQGATYSFAPHDQVTGSHIVVLGPAQVYGLAHLGLMGFQGPVVIYVGKSTEGVWERLSNRTMIPDSFVGNARSHLRIGGPPGAEILPCDCK